MKRFLLLLLFCIPAALFSQTAKFALLDAKNPLIGEWEWVAHDTASPAAPFTEQDWIYFRFSAGAEQSMGALTWDSDKGYGCPSLFLAFSNGKTISGTLSSSCSPELKGKKFTFDYEYDYAHDQLLITIRGVTSVYKRRPAP